MCRVAGMTGRATTTHSNDHKELDSRVPSVHIAYAPTGMRMYTRQ